MLSWPNRITILRILLVIPFILLLLNAADGPAYRYGAMAVVVLIGIGDAADGLIARRTGQITRIGSVLDPLADKALMISALVILAIPGVLRDNPDAPPLHLPQWVAVTLVSRDLFLLVGAVVVFVLAGVFQAMPSTSGKAATTMQFLTILATLAWPDLLAVLPRATPIALHAIWGLAVVLGVASLLGYIRMGSKLIASAGSPS